MDPVDARNVTTRRRARVAVAAALASAALSVWVALHPADPEVPPSALASDEEPPAPSSIQPYRADLRQVLQPRQYLAKKAGGDRVLTVFEAPERGSAYLVRGDGFVGNPEVIEGPIPIAGDTLARLAATLSDPMSYVLDMAKGCGPRWHVWVRLEKGDDVVDLLLCFSCAQMRVSLAGERVGFLELRGSAAFAALAREMFPNDASLRKW